MQKEIEIFHKQLNREDCLPEIYLRRNHPIYPLISYVNIILGLYTSSNFNLIPLFIFRAIDHIESFEEKRTDPYIILVTQYLNLMMGFLSTIEFKTDVAKRDFMGLSQSSFFKAD